MRSSPRRWPLHPTPGELESMSSWLVRIARLYGARVADLLGPNLGAIAQHSHVLDEDPPPEIFTVLSERTGVGVAQLRAMTLSGWVPWLFDAYPATQRDADEMFYTYVRQDSVLLALGEATQFQVARHRHWRGPWIPAEPTTRTCPLCAAEFDPRRALYWDLPLTIGCLEHRCRLETGGQILAAVMKDEQPQPVPITGPLAVLEGYTHQALIGGQVELPGRTVHAGIWFRLLRCLLDELSLALTTLRPLHARHTLEQIWAAAGERERAGITVWAPYENLPWNIQEKLLNAAAVAIALAVQRRIIPRGSLGPVLTEPAHAPVYDGDAPRPPQRRQDRLHRSENAPDLMTGVNAWINAWINAARSDPEPARGMLRTLTALDPHTDIAERRRFLISEIGIPPEFLTPPNTPTNPGRRPRPPYTRPVMRTILETEGFDRDDVTREITLFIGELRLLHGITDTRRYRFSGDDLEQLRARLSL
ncbi:TniQ family protein (plasmid) [Nocardia sp. CWNU-33]|uniref:TniQ family protein n=1 Tax=Nocardia sp. CWNU-33 TaxID=3392117 RepID=UPI00398F87F8